jgi:hypothetical protein
MTQPTSRDDHSTPGKPKDHASRQQKHSQQGTQTGANDLDKRAPAPGSGDEPAPRPPNAK